MEGRAGVSNSPGSFYASEFPRIAALKLFGKSEWAPLWVSYESAKRGAKRPYRHFVLPKTHDPGLSSYFPNSFSRQLGE